MIAIFLLPLLLAGTLTTHAEERTTAGDYVDVHMHLDPSMASPRTGRRGSEVRDFTFSAEHLLLMMNEWGIEKAMVMPPPQVGGQRGAYTYRDLLEVLAAHKGRLFLGAGGGILNPLIQNTPADGVTDELRQIFAREARDMVQSGARVFGEMTAMHLCMNPKHFYEAAPADHPLFLLLADLAAQYDVPIDLHIEALAENLPAPPWLLSACDQNPAVIPATLPALERLLSHNRGARIVWQHIGWDNTGEMTPELLRRLLTAHPNLYLAIKAVLDNRPNRIHNDDFEIVPEWLALFEEFTDRVVVGADEFARSPKVRGGYKKPPFFAVTWRAVGSLPPELREKIGRDNAVRIYRLE